MVNTNLNFFQRIFYAVAKPNRYYRLTKTRNASITGFVFLLLLITTFLTMFPAFHFVLGNNGFYHEISENVPYFEFKDGQLFVQQSYEYKNTNEYVLIDTNVDYFDVSQVDKSYNTVILVSRTNLVSYQSYRIQEFDFSTLGNLYFNKDILYTLKPFLFFILIIGGIFAYLFGVGFYFLTALLFSLVGLIVSSLTNMNLPYAVLYKTAIFSKVTIALFYALLNLISKPLPFYIKIIFALIVTSIYVVFGILSHRSRDAYAENGFPMGPNQFNGNNYANPNGYQNPPTGYYQNTRNNNYNNGYYYPNNQNGNQTPGNPQQYHNPNGYQVPGNHQANYQPPNNPNSGTYYGNQPNMINYNYTTETKPEEKHNQETNSDNSTENKNTP